MQDDEFEWDDQKAARNLAKHKISFEEARKIFDDPSFVERPDFSEPYDEDRYNVYGIVGSRLLRVSVTYRGPRVRILSARK